MNTCRNCKGLDAYCGALRDWQTAQDDPDGYEAATGLLASLAAHPDDGMKPMDADVIGAVYGWDIGGRTDSTAGAALVVSTGGPVITGTEELPLRTGRDDIGYDQWSADTIVSRVRALRRRLGRPTRKGDALYVVLDETGPGRTIAATVKRSLACTPGVRVLLFSITAGDEPKQTGDAWSVPKSRLMEALVTAVRRGDGGKPWLAVSKDGEGRKLLRQVDSVEVKELPSGHLKIESRGHDDLVLAAALAVYVAKWLLSGAGDVKVLGNPARHVPKTAVGRAMQAPAAPVQPVATAPEADPSRAGQGIVGQGRARQVDRLAGDAANVRAQQQADRAPQVSDPASGLWPGLADCDRCTTTGKPCRDHFTGWQQWRDATLKAMYTQQTPGTHALARSSFYGTGGGRRAAVGGSVWSRRLG